MCQDILEASILPALPSDKHMPGIEPSGEGKTTDAIQSTPSLLYEPAEETSKKYNPRGEAQTMCSSPSEPWFNQSYTPAQIRITVRQVLGLIKREIVFSMFCHLPPHYRSQKKVSKSIIKRY